MTLPFEEGLAIMRTREFLLRLLWNPGLHTAMRMEARGLLKHYPGNYRVYELYKKTGVPKPPEVDYRDSCNRLVEQVERDRTEWGLRPKRRKRRRR